MSASTLRYQVALTVNEDNEGREDDQEDGGIYKRKDTMFYNDEYNEEEASLEHKGESSSSKLSDISDNKDEEDDETGMKRR